MTTVVGAVTCAVLTVNVVRVWPAGTTTVSGTTARSVSLLASWTTALPVGAAARSVTVPIDDIVPVPGAGLTVRARTALEPTKNRFVLPVVPPDDADPATAVVCVTGAVLAVNVTLVRPAGTVTLAGTVT